MTSILILILSLILNAFAGEATNQFCAEHPDSETCAEKNEAPASNPDSSTHVYIVGVPEFKNYPGADKVPEAEEGCKGLKRFFIEEANFPERNVTALCGEDAMRGAIFSNFSYSIGNMKNGDTLVLVWLGPGISHEGDAHFLPYDIEPQGDPLYGKVDPDLLPAYIQAMRQSLKFNMVVLTDSVYAGLLDDSHPYTGPSAKDFAQSELVAISATNGHRTSKPGAFTQDIMTCWRERDFDDDRDRFIDTEELSACLAQKATDRGYETGYFQSAPHVTLSDYARSPRFTPGSEPQPLGMKQKTRTILGATSLGLGIAAVATSVTAYQMAGEKRGRLASPVGRYPSESEFREELDRYGRMRNLTYASGIAAIPLTIGGTIVLSF